MEYEFDLDNAIADLNSVPEDLRHFYSQGEGGYKVATNMVGAAKRINGLTTNLKTERTKKSEANGEAAKHRLSAKGFSELVAGLTDLPEEKRNPEGLKAYLEELATKATAGGRKGGRGHPQSIDETSVVQR